MKNIHSWEELIDSGVPQKKSGFFDLPKTEQCTHPEHNPPNHICIPQGNGYRHVCPCCGRVQVLIPPQISL
jgi:hypothetical protein